MNKRPVEKISMAPISMEYVVTDVTNAKLKTSMKMKLLTNPNAPNPAGKRTS
jgi:hypothetical protein